MLCACLNACNQTAAAAGSATRSADMHLQQAALSDPHQHGHHTICLHAQVLRDVRLGHLLDRQRQGSNPKSAEAVLDTEADWASVLSLGEQQRLAFAR